MNYFDSEFFRFSFTLFGFFALYGFAIFLFRNRIKNYIAKQPNEKKLKMSQNFPKLIRMIKILLWIMPIYSVVRFVITPDETRYFFVTFMGLGYFGFLIGYFILKMMLEATKEESEKE